MSSRNRRNTLAALLFAASFASLTSWSNGNDSVGGRHQVGAEPNDQSLGSAFVTCTGRSYSPPPAQGFQHTRSALVVTVSHPQHSAQDVIALPASSTVVPGKFAYGRFSKDLEDENIELFIDDCAGWRSLGTARTDGDGRTSIPLDLASEQLGVGLYELRQVVRGDASVVTSWLRVVPAGTHLVVFDIDGTLTTSDAEIVQDAIDEFFLPIYNHQYVPEAFASGVELTQLYADKGYVNIYLTGRPYWLTGITRGWLEQLGYAVGNVHLTDSNAEALPSEAGVGTFKAEYLKTLTGLGYVIDYAYGNAATDVYAYAVAGIPASKTWLIGSVGGQGGTNAVVDDWTAHLVEAAAHPDANQPF